jgi:peroxiredoxin
LKKFKTDHNPTFPVIPDPALVTYKQYGVEDGGIMEAMKTMLLNPLTAMKMMLGGGTIDGSAAGLPADFLIDEKGIITTAYYGADFTDHISLDVIEEFSAS